MISTGKISRKASIVGMFALGILATGCGSGNSPAGLGVASGAEQPFSFGDISGRAVTTNPPVVTNAAQSFGTSGTTVVGLTGQISNMEITDSTKNLAATKLIYSSNRDANFFNYQLYVMNPDGTNRIRLTTNNTNDSEAQYSPDGSKIVFSTNRDGNYEVYTMNADGTNLKRLTSNGGTTFDYQPCWSPDSAKIAFVSNRNGFYEIYTMNADGSNQVQLTNIQNNTYFPSWSPDGSKIVFETSKDGNREIYTINTNGTNQTRLTNNAFTDGHPVWSPDGALIAFHTNRDGNSQIYVMSPDGSKPTRLSNSASNDANPVWSPDGMQIAFISDRSGVSQVYTMNADGSSQVRLTNDLKPSSTVGWSPFMKRRALIGGGAPLNSASGFLFSKQGQLSKSVLVYQTTNATDFNQVILNPLTGMNNQGSSLLIQIEPTTASVTLSALQFWNLDDLSWSSVAPQGFTMSGALVSFSAVNGKVDYVIPFKAANRSVGKPSIQEDGKVRTLRGNFAGVYDSKGTNLTVHPVSSVRIDTQTGKLIGAN